MKKEKEVKIIGKMFFYSKFLTRNAITDWIQGIRNILGLELESYNNLIEEAATECLEKTKHLKKKWWRMDTEPANNGSFIVKIYGEIQ